jgi:hypothetical protein
VIESDQGPPSRIDYPWDTLLKPTEVEYGELAWSLDRNLIAAEASTSDTDSSGSELHVIDATQGVVLHRVRVAGGFVSSMS